MTQEDEDVSVIVNGKRKWVTWSAYCKIMKKKALKSTPLQISRHTAFGAT